MASIYNASLPFQAQIIAYLARVAFAQGDWKRGRAMRLFTHTLRMGAYGVKRDERAKEAARRSSSGTLR